MQLIKTIVAQITGLLIALMLVRLTATPGMLPLMAAQAMAAAIISRIIGQPGWWIPIHMLFAPSALGLLTLQLPAWAYLMLATLLALIFWGTIKGDVPLFLSSDAVNEALKEIVDREQASTFIDLGAGLGSVTVPLAEYRPKMSVEAWERAPIPWLITHLRSQHLPNTLVYRKSFWECDLSIFDVVFAFLSPAPMPQLGVKVIREMKPGSLLVSSTFPMPDWEPESVIAIEDGMQTRLYCYRIPT